MIKKKKFSQAFLFSYREKNVEVVALDSRKQNVDSFSFVVLDVFVILDEHVVY